MTPQTETAPTASPSASPALRWTLLDDRGSDGRLYWTCTKNGDMLYWTVGFYKAGLAVVPNGCLGVRTMP